MTTKKCQTCLEEKPLTEFYKCGTQYQSRCKECVKRDRNSRSLYRKVEMLPFQEWSTEAQEAANTWLQLRRLGGKLTYASSAADAMADRAEMHERTVLASNGGDPEALLDDAALRATDVLSNASLAGVQEYLYQLQHMCYDLQHRVAVLERHLDLGLSPNGSSSGSDDSSVAAVTNEDRLSAQDIQERKNALVHLREVLSRVDMFAGDAEELQEYLIQLLNASKQWQTQGYITANQVRSVVMPWEAEELAMPEELLAFCSKFIIPGCAGAQRRSDYALEASKLQSWTLPNYFEVPWASIPSSAGYTGGSTDNQ